MGQELRDEFLGLPKMLNCEEKKVAKVGFHIVRRRAYTWDIQ